MNYEQKFHRTFRRAAQQNHGAPRVELERVWREARAVWGRERPVLDLESLNLRIQASSDRKERGRLRWRRRELRREAMPLKQRGRRVNGQLGKFQ